mmetsp:Transcript_6854/g.15797  ORF Transcript_6854/g.15797 Transcript_6854/m.15797 type:complete len:217 (-) Transcript_6854:116-766(-)|eukprot:CAMPEP_0114540050 /NCGR_PEP_ID=MMETSP0114-20121206/560_1 /TAXON_ID=31324 /ORGANISM="Goniomonas sp, Strain m" /LENGTH=216 /DNA_ID=CAMNT_0001724185 /DNA_START=84 /DNA_END=734 /DNA_ORIENTATION=-
MEDTIMGVCVPDLSVISSVFAVYSIFTQYLLVILLCLCLLTTRNTSYGVALLGLLFVALQCWVLKWIIEDPRPKDSCDRGPGMPSAHAAVAIFFMVEGILEAYINARFTFLDWIMRVLLHVVMFAPVPYARVYLHYHTAEQAMAGSVLGAVNAVALFYWLHFHEGWRHVQEWCQTGMLAEFGLENPPHLQYAPINVSEGGGEVTEPDNAEKLSKST